MRQIRVVAVLLLVAGISLVPASPAQGLVISVFLHDNFYEDPVEPASMDLQVIWWGTVPPVNSHSATQDRPWKLWDTGEILPGNNGFVSPEWAGTFAYHCTFHEGMTGTLRIPVDLHVDGSTVTIYAADVRAPDGLKYQLQQRRTGQPWKMVYEGRGGAYAHVYPNGEWDFRSRVLHICSNEATGWSPPRHLTLPI